MTHAKIITVYSGPCNFCTVLLEEAACSHLLYYWGLKRHVWCRTKEQERIDYVI